MNFARVINATNQFSFSNSRPYVKVSGQTGSDDVFVDVTSPTEDEAHTFGAKTSLSAMLTDLSQGKPHVIQSEVYRIEMRAPTQGSIKIVATCTKTLAILTVWVDAEAFLALLEGLPTQD